MEASSHDWHELMSEIDAIKKRLSRLESTGTTKHPTLEACNEYAKKIGLPEDQASWFFNFYQSNGWKVGRNAMKSWESAMNNWRKNWLARGVGASGANGHSQSIWEIKQVLEVKQQEAKALVNRSYNDSGAFHEWTNEPDRQRYMVLKREIINLNARIGGAA